MSTKALRITELETLVRRYQTSYYNGEAEISDAEFDALWDELKKLDPQNSLLHAIGADTGTFAKARHVMPMGSQDKAANPEEFLTWAKKQTFTTFLVEYKLDGASLELQYENGNFVRGVTRGDGIIGDDITKNVLKMKGLVLELPNDGKSDALTGAIRGEVIMTHQVHREHFSDKANCRNAANGLMKRKDGEGTEHLQIVCYDAHFTPAPYADEEEKLKQLKAWGFTVPPVAKCKSAEEVIHYRNYVMDIRNTIPYDIDGLVVKSLEIDLVDMQRNRPEKQIAFKFSLEEAVSILRNINWSESGATYTPIGEFDQVELAGTRVQKASLNNPNMIRSLNLKIGSHIVVTKRGEIIPKIESLVLNPDDALDIEFPHTCSTCQMLLVDEGTRLYCPNLACKKRIHHQLEKWISVLDVRDFGIGLIRRLFDSGRIHSISDLYTLTQDELAALDRMGEKSAAKVIASLQNKRTVSLARFIAGFDIEGIGETLVEKLVADGFNTLQKLLDATVEQLSAVSGFGEITAQNLVKGLAECRAEMLTLSQSHITIPEPIIQGRLAGKSFCFTGELNSLKRSQAEELVKNLGGTAKSAVTKDLTYLVTNDSGSSSSKNKKAHELAIPILNEEQFLELVR